jgi:ubiquinone/menaquinone biosynthesis C-methylase UbiE
MFERCAEYYDMLYHEKGYDSECDFLEQIFSNFSSKPPKRILELGCGTGAHTLPLAQRGYSITAVDRSERMLAIGRGKVAEMEKGNVTGSVTFRQGDIGALNIGANQPFDSMIALFAVFSYLGSNCDMTAAFRGTRRYLESGGLFIFDTWFGPAVMMQKPTNRCRIVDYAHQRILSFAMCTLNVVGHTVRIDYTLLCVANGQVVDEVNESRWQRCWHNIEFSSSYARLWS